MAELKKGNSRLLHLHEYDVKNTGSSDESQDRFAFSLEKLLENFQIKITNIEDDSYHIEFDMIGIDVSIANAFRRILIAEVPTMAIDKVFLYNNTSIVQDEVLAHRLGLVPIKVDPRLFEYRPIGEEEENAEDTIQFQLKIKCTKKSHPPKDACVPDKLYNHSTVFTKDMEFIPLGDQEKMHGCIRPVQEDIMLAKLRPGHEIDIKAHCVKGIGRDHAKFSPVATASYRLLPEITLLEEVSGEKAGRLARCFSDGVIEIVEENGKEVARVANARKDTCSRNVHRYDDLKNLVSLSKVKDYFLFSIESTGALPSEELFLEAVGILKEKCRYFLTELKSLEIEKKK